MFQFSGFPPVRLCIYLTVIRYCLTGFPHSDICGSRDICSSPQLFAACHVLLRLLMPRHSPCTLFSLISLCELNIASEIVFPLRKNFTSLFLLSTHLRILFNFQSTLRSCRFWLCQTTFGTFFLLTFSFSEIKSKWWA